MRQEMQDKATTNKRTKLFHFVSVRELIAAIRDLLAQGYSYDLNNVSSGSYYDGSTIELNLPDNE